MQAVTPNLHAQPTSCNVSGNWEVNLSGTECLPIQPGNCAPYAWAATFAFTANGTNFTGSTPDPGDPSKFHTYNGTISGSHVSGTWQFPIFKSVNCGHGFNMYGDGTFDGTITNCDRIDITLTSNHWFFNDIPPYCGPVSGATFTGNATLQKKRCPSTPAMACGANHNVPPTFPIHFNQGHKTVDADANGETGPHSPPPDPDSNYTACCEMKDNLWHIRVVSMESPIDTEVQIKQPIDITGPNDPTVTSSTFCSIVTDLQLQIGGSVSSGTYGSSMCTLAHEQVHQQEWIDNFSKRWKKGENDIEAITLPADQATTPLNVVQKKKTDIQATFDTVYGLTLQDYLAIPDDQGDPPDKAGDRCRAQLQKDICQKAKSNKWPKCPSC